MPFKDIVQLATGSLIKTEPKQFTEKYLILGILWEGDLQIHSDKEAMKTNIFKEIIAHGNSAISISIGLLFKFMKLTDSNIICKEINTTFVKPVYIGDIIKPEFKIIENKFLDSKRVELKMLFEIFKNGNQLISKGNLTLQINSY